MFSNGGLVSAQFSDKLGTYFGGAGRAPTGAGSSTFSSDIDIASRTRQTAASKD